MQQLISVYLLHANKYFLAALCSAGLRLKSLGLFSLKPLLIPALFCESSPVVCLFEMGANTIQHGRTTKLQISVKMSSILISISLLTTPDLGSPFLDCLKAHS